MKRAAFLSAAVVERDLGGLLFVVPRTQLLAVGDRPATTPRVRVDVIGFNLRRASAGTGLVT